MINVVDMIMGGGKSSAAITYMNEHPDRLYVYVTPFLEETERVKNACSGLRFVEPSDRIPDYRHSKRMHLRALVNQRRNVAITHALFKIIDDVTAQAIVDNGYTIIIDEVIDVFEPMNESEDDMDMLLAGGFLDKLGGDSECEYYRPSEKAKTYKSGVFNEFFSKAQFGQIVRTNGWDSGKPAKYGFWQLNRRLFTLSDEIYILTYLFDGMPLRGFLESNGFKYRRIGTMKCDDGKYRFCEHGVIPPYVEHLKDMVHVCDKDSINAIGDGKRALSVNWCRTARKDGRMAQLSRHVYTFFRNHVPQWIGADQRLWSTYKDARKDVEGKGFTDSFLSYNCEATNKYGDRAALAYCVNIFPNPNLQSYLEHIGVKMDWDQYALAIMIQWVWRSRIRNGQEIWLYVPSRRMRELFLKWMDDAVAAYQKEQEVTDKNGQGETVLV